MPTPDVKVKKGTPNTGTENQQVLERSVDPRLNFFKYDEHPFASLLLTNGQSLVKRDDSNAPKIEGQPLNKKAVSNPKYEWFEDEAYRMDFKPATDLAGGDTSIDIDSDDSDWFRQGDALLLTNSNGQTERVIVKTVNSSSLDIRMPDGSTRSSGISMTDADEFYLMENVRAEDSESPSIRSTKSDNQFQYLELVSEPYGLTDVKQATAHYTGDPMMQEKRKAYTRLLRRLEQMILFGTRAISSASTNPERHAGGLFYYLNLYSDVPIRDMGGQPVTKPELDAFLGNVTSNGSKDKVALCDQRAFNAINSMPYEKVNPDSFSIGKFGMNIKEVFGPFGTIKLAHEPLFDQMNPYHGTMAVVDMEYTDFLYLENNGVNLDIKQQDVILPNGKLSEEGQYVGMVAPQFTTLKHFGWMKNIGF